MVETLTEKILKRLEAFEMKRLEVFENIVIVTIYTIGNIDN